MATLKAYLLNRSKKSQGTCRYAQIIFFIATLFLIGDPESGKAQVSSNNLFVGAVSPTFAFTGSSTRGGSASLRGYFPDAGVLLGPVRVVPSLGFGEVFTDNAFRMNTSREWDFINVVSPGIQALFPLGTDHQFIANYNATWLFYSRTDGNDADAQDAWGRFAFSYPGGLNLDLQGSYTKGFIPRGSELDIQEPEITKWDTNGFVGQAVFFGNQLGYRARYRLTKWNFLNNDQARPRDRISHSADAAVFGAVAPKTFALIRFGIRDNIYDVNTQLNSFSFIVGTGIKWDATAKTRGEVQVGYQVLNFDNAPVATPPAPDLSTGGDKQEIIRVTGRVSWRPTTRLTVEITPFRTIEQAAVFESSVLTQTGVFLTASQLLGPRTFLNGTFRFADDDFDSPVTVDGVSEDRDDQRVSFGMGLEYRTIKWFGFRADYFFQNRSSTIDQFRFFANTIMLSVQGRL